jgi:hypothetical protein
MTATLTAPPIEQVIPKAVVRVRPGDLRTAQMVLIGAGVAALAISLGVGLSASGEVRKRFLFSYLTGYMGVLGICLCGLFFTMLQHITRAGWGVGLRRVAENLAGALPVMLLLYVPIVLGFDDLFGHWTGAEIEPGQAGFDAVVAGKHVYLNKPFFFARVILYFAIWIGLTWFFNRTSVKQDENGDPALTLRMARVAAPGLLLFALTITFAAVDWIMTLNPHWFSTMFGVCYFAGSYMSFLAFAILFVQWLGRRGYLREVVNVEHYHDLGKLMFAFMVFWTYVNFGQYMLIWYANLPEETTFFQLRKEGGWSAVGTLLVFGHFFVPFAFLMSRHIKRNMLTLCSGAAFMLIIHWIDMQYLVIPNMLLPHAGHGAEQGPAHASDHGEALQALTEGGNPLFGHFGHNVNVWLHGMTVHDVLCYAGMLSLVAGVTLFFVRRNNLMPLRDPRLAEAAHFLNH